MKHVSIREIKHETRRVMDMVAAGQTLEICNRHKPVAILSPPAKNKAAEKPDFMVRLQKIYGDSLMKTTGTEVIRETRGER